MSGDVASPGSMLMITGDKLAETFSPFAAGTPGPPATDEHGFTCSQVRCAGMHVLACALSQTVSSTNYRTGIFRPRLAGGGINTEHRTHDLIGTCLDLASLTRVGLWQPLSAAYLQYAPCILAGK